MPSTPQAAVDSAATEKPVGGGRHARGLPEYCSPLWQATQLCLWLIASSAALPDTALAGLGLNQAAIQRLTSEHASELEALRCLRGAVQRMDRSEYAELLRTRLTGMTMAAQTPAEMAAVARTVRSLPDWVWDGALRRADGARGASGGGSSSAVAHRAVSVPAATAVSASRAAESAVQLVGAPRPPHAPAPEDVGLLAEWQQMLPSPLLLDGLAAPVPQPAPLNRQQRRALEKEQRRQR